MYFDKETDDRESDNQVMIKTVDSFSIKLEKDNDIKDVFIRIEEMNIIADLINTDNRTK